MSGTCPVLFMNTSQPCGQGAVMSAGAPNMHNRRVAHHEQHRAEDSAGLERRDSFDDVNFLRWLQFRACCAQGCKRKGVQAAGSTPQSLDSRQIICWMGMGMARSCARA